MYRGRFQLGEELTLLMLATDASGLVAAPTEAPTADLVIGGSIRATVQLPAIDRPVMTGLFGMRLFLGARFPVGVYEAIYRYRVGSFNGILQDNFEIAAGGNPDGSVLSMYGFQKPFATFLIQQLDSGKVVRGKNPRL